MKFYPSICSTRKPLRAHSMVGIPTIAQGPGPDPVSSTESSTETPATHVAKRKASLPSEEIPRAKEFAVGDPLVNIRKTVGCIWMYGYMM